MEFSNKIDVLISDGCIELTDEYLNNLNKSKDYMDINIKKVIEAIKESNKKPILLIKFDNTFNIYTEEFIINNDIEIIRRGTINLLS